MSLAGFVRITRPVNCLAAGAAAIVAYVVATGTVVPGVLLLFAAVALITAAGNVINDYFDVEIDRVNRPGRPIPSGAVSAGSARLFAAVLFLGGLLVCLGTNPICLAIAFFNVGLLIIYAAWLKRTLLLGNIAVAYLAGSMFLFGGALGGMAGLVQVFPFTGMTFFAMLARELVKDAEDVEGDRANGAVTLPIRSGVRMTVTLAIASAILGSVASLVPVLWWGTWYAAGILIVDLIILYGCVRAAGCTTPDEVKASGASAFLKAGMFASLLVFVLAALLL